MTPQIIMLILIPKYYQCPTKRLIAAKEQFNATIFSMWIGFIPATLTLQQCLQLRYSSVERNIHNFRVHLSDFRHLF